MKQKKYLFRKVNAFMGGRFKRCDLVFSESSLFFEEESPDMAFEKIFNCENHILVPGFADVHVHLREPGSSYKETIGSGTIAAAAAGYTVVCAMPNLSPAPDSLENLQIMLDIIQKDALIKVLPFGAITKDQKGEGVLSKMEELATFVAGFSDDGKGIQSDELMEQAMLRAKELNLPIVAHCEDESLLTPGGCVHDGDYAKANGFTGISSASEWKQIERDISLVRKTGCRYHVCHISTKESVDLIKQAKKEGLPVSCETAPHYLLLCDEDLIDEGRFKMNPPLRSKEDRNALLEGIKEGVIDCIATDHAPHSDEEKSKGLKGSSFGIVGIETAFPLLYTNLVKKDIISLERLVELMCLNPRKLFNLNNNYENGNFTLIDLDAQYKIDPSEFFSKGKSTPFTGYDVFSKVLLTVCEGKTVFERSKV